MSEVEQDRGYSRCLALVGPQWALEPAQEEEVPSGGEAWGTECTEHEGPEGEKGMAWGRGLQGDGRRVHSGADQVSKHFKNNRNQVSHCCKRELQSGKRKLE